MPPKLGAVVSASWAGSADPESGLAWCHWAVSTEAEGDPDLLPFHPAPGSSATADVGEALIAAAGRAVTRVYNR